MAAKSRLQKRVPTLAYKKIGTFPISQKTTIATNLYQKQQASIDPSMGGAINIFTTQVFYSRSCRNWALESSNPSNQKRAKLRTSEGSSNTGNRCHVTSTRWRRLF